MSDEKVTESFVDEVIEDVEDNTDNDVMDVPSTADKALGHEVLLNPNAEVVPDHHQGDGPVAPTRGATGFSVFLPRESGMYWSVQSDGMVMKYPTMEGTLIPLRLFKANPGRLPEANYLEYDNEEEMKQIWDEIEDDLPVEVKDVSAPDGYAQTQEAIRWVKITDYDDIYRNSALGEEYQTVSTYDKWAQWAVENDSKIAFIYRNCD